MTDKSDENARKIIAAGREIVVLVLHAAPNPFFMPAAPGPARRCAQGMASQGFWYICRQR